MTRVARLGVVDWGIGGFDLVAKLRAEQRPVDVSYWSDAGAPPYGTLPRDALAERLAYVLGELSAGGAEAAVVACNAASTVLDHPRVRATELARAGRLLGVIEPAVAAIVARALSEVVVIGGHRTIESGAYARPLAASGCRVIGRVAQPLSALIERGVIQGEELDDCLDTILAPVRSATALALACTHYVAVREAIEARMPALRVVIDPAAEALEALGNQVTLAGGTGRIEVSTTGDPAQTRRGAELAFGIGLPLPRAVPLHPNAG